MNFTDDSRLIVSGFAFLEFAPLECFSQKCIEDLEIGSSRKFLLRKHCFMLQ